MLSTALATFLSFEAWVGRLYAARALNVFDPFRSIIDSYDEDEDDDDDDDDDEDGDGDDSGGGGDDDDDVDHMHLAGTFKQVQIQVSQRLIILIIDHQLHYRDVPEVP